MSLWHIAWGYIWNRKLITLLTVMSVALGVALISAVHTLREETKRRFEEEGQAFDIVVGAKGSPLQLVLSSVYFLDAPTGNINYSDYEELLHHEDVRAAFPIGLGDTYRHFRIVGTVPELMHHKWIVDPISGRERVPFQLAEGRFFEKDFEAVVGSVVAQQTGLKIGDTFVGTHGFMEGEHAEYPYTVVGILKPGGTPNDRAIFTTLGSVWEVHSGHESHDEHPEGEEHHEDEKEVTAVLVNLQSPAMRFTFLDYVNREMNVMAAIPVNEIQKLYAQVLATANTVLLSVAYLVVVASALTIMIGLYMSIFQRRRDLAIMRALGASSIDIFGSVILEAFWVTILGIGVGWLLGNTVAWALGMYLTQRIGMVITAFGLSGEMLFSYAVVIIVGLLAGILPARQAYRTDVARDLAAT